MKTIIAGSRILTSEKLVRKAIKEAKKQGINITEVVSGTARGVDSIGASIAKQYGIPVSEFPANWNKHGKSAGYIRNSEMAEYADALIAVYDGSSAGTRHMINIATATNLPKYIHKTEYKYFDESKYVEYLFDYQVFVFGSNEAGRHGSGAAKTAIDKFGAIYGQGIGMTGNKCYGIPTKNQFIRSLTIDKIRLYVYDFISFAKANPNKEFIVTKIGCGLAGFKDEQIAPMFKGSPTNCVFSNDWIDYLEDV